MPAPERPPARPVAARDRHRGVALGPEHTRIPNLLLDLVYPWLSAGEQACMLYIVRRTYGFASPTIKGQRKQWDRIALSQFVSGTSSGEYVMDLGTGLSRTAVKNSLDGLESRGLVRVSYECPTVLKKGKAVGCGWNESDDDHLTKPQIDPKTNAHSCPRCRRTLSKAYSLRPLTPGWVKRFLTANDPQKRQWAYDPDLSRFYPLSDTDQETARASRDSQLEADRKRAAELREQLWFPDEVEQIIGHALSRLKSGKMAETRVINGFLAPIIELQTQFPRAIVQYALKEGVRRKVAAGPGTDQRWYNYIKVVAKSRMEQQAGGKQEAELAVAQSTVENELGRCGRLNRDGQREQARQVLHDLITNQLDRVQAEFGGDRPLARRHLLEAFKRGVEDYVYVRDYTSSLDFLPEWTWEDDEQRAG